MVCIMFLNHNDMGNSFQIIKAILLLPAYQIEFQILESKIFRVGTAVTNKIVITAVVYSVNIK